MKAVKAIIGIYIHYVEYNGVAKRKYFSWHRDRPYTHTHTHLHPVYGIYISELSWERDWNEGN